VSVRAPAASSSRRARRSLPSWCTIRRRLWPAPQRSAWIASPATTQVVAAELAAFVWPIIASSVCSIRAGFVGVRQRRFPALATSVLRRTPCRRRRYPSPALGSTGSATGCPALLVGFVANYAGV
jgi:hypothetical protein